MQSLSAISSDNYIYSNLFEFTALCSHHSPCFPGNCSDTINCQCNDGFMGDRGLNRCKTCMLSKFIKINSNIE